MTENGKIAKTFNSFFETVTDSLNLFSWSSKVKVCDDKVQGIIPNFSNHSSILKIKEKFRLNKRFSFQHVSEATIRKVLKNLPSDKVPAGEVPIKILKESTFCFPELTNCINESLTNNKFPDTLKLSNITPVPNDKANYRPVSILPLVSKVFEKIMYDQLYEYIEYFLNQLQCGFRKAHSTMFMNIEQSDICNFADDNTLYSCGERLTKIKENLGSATKSILNWFRLNSLKGSTGKFLGISLLTSTY